MAAKIDALVRAARAAYEDDNAQSAYDKTVAEIAEGLRRRNLLHDESFVRSYPEFAGYIQALSLAERSDHDLGFDVPDKQYFAETRQYVQIPGFLMKQTFLRWVSRYESLAQAKAYLRHLNATRSPSDRLIFFSYTSRHLGTPDNDNSFRRLLVVVPGNSKAGVPEKWVQFGITDPGQRVRIRNVSVVSAMVRKDGTFDTYFKDFFRTYRRDGQIAVKGRWELGYGDDDCTQCHKSGVIPIFPAAGSVSPDERQAVEAVNQRLRSYGSPRFENYFSENTFGPGLGSASKTSREQRFGDSFGRTGLAQSMDCTACHRPHGVGSLNWPMDSVLIDSYVEGGQMPLGQHLASPVRSELYRKLIDEYFATDDANPGILKSWLLGRMRHTN